MSVSLVFTQKTHRNVKNRRVSSSLKTCSIGNVLWPYCWLTQRRQHVQAKYTTRAVAPDLVQSVICYVYLRHGPVSKKLSLQVSIGMAWDGSLFESDSNKRQGAKTGPLFESPPRLLLKSGLEPLFRYGINQTISGRHDCSVRV